MAKTKTIGHKNNKSLRIANNDLHLLTNAKGTISNQITSEVLENTYNKINKSYSIFPDVLDEIFSFVALQYKNKAIDIPDFDPSTIQLKEKIKINFIKDEDLNTYQTVTNEYRVLWEAKTYIEKYIASNFTKYEFSFYALLKKIRYSFINHHSNYYSNVKAPVQDISVLYDIRDSIVPKEKLTDFVFLEIALAVVLYFFEYCDFGNKHIDDPETLFTKIDKKDDFT